MGFGWRRTIKNRKMKTYNYTKLDNGYEYEDMHYDGLQDLIQNGILKFCNCGNPHLNLLYILGGFELIYEKGNERYNEKYQERVVKHFGSLEAALFFYYWTETLELTEHGGSVYGSWLDDKGEALLEMLREWKATEFES